MSSNQDQEMTGKVKQLAEAVKGLTAEAKRLQTNLDRMHSLQNSMYHVSQRMVTQWTKESGYSIAHDHSNTNENSEIDSITK